MSPLISLSLSLKTIRNVPTSIWSCIASISFIQTFIEGLSFLYASHLPSIYKISSFSLTSLNYYLNASIQYNVPTLKFKILFIKLQTLTTCNLIKLLYLSILDGPCKNELNCNNFLLFNILINEIFLFTHIYQGGKHNIRGCGCSSRVYLDSTLDSKRQRNLYSDINRNRFGKGETLERSITSKFTSKSFHPTYDKKKNSVEDGCGLRSGWNGIAV